jgi:Uma2 family endonuclease
MTDMKVQPLGSASFFYPDVLVTCSAADRTSALVKHEPKLVVEVLSPATAAYDRGDKFAHYRRIASLEEYALVDLDSRRTDVYRKGNDALWVLHPCEPGQPVLLASVAVTITAATLFAEVEDPPASDSAATA